MPGVQHTQMERELPTGVDVLVVGGGIGGLTCAIEAYRKGHNVRILERNQEGQYSGEVIMITTSALETPKEWPGFMERVRAFDPEQYAYNKYHKCAEHLLTGTELGNTNLPPEYKYKSWTVRELLGASERGGVVEDEGDWS